MKVKHMVTVLPPSFNEEKSFLLPVLLWTLFLLVSCFCINVLHVNVLHVYSKIVHEVVLVLQGTRHVENKGRCILQTRE